MIGMLGGMILYYLVQKLKESNISGCKKIVLTIVNLALSALLIWYVINQPTYFKLERWTVAFLCIAVVVLSLLEKDYLTALLNNKVTNRLLAYLGGISLYVYMLHYPVAILVIRILGKNTEETIYTFWEVFIPTVIITVALSIITKFVMERTVLKK